MAHLKKIIYLINIIKAIKKFKYYKDISLRQFSSLFFGLFTIFDTG